MHSSFRSDAHVVEFILLVIQHQYSCRSNSGCMVTWNRNTSGCPCRAFVTARKECCVLTNGAVMHLRADVASATRTMAMAAVCVQYPCLVCPTNAFWWNALITPLLNGLESSYANRLHFHLLRSIDDQFVVYASVPGLDVSRNDRDSDLA